MKKILFITFLVLVSGNMFGKKENKKEVAKVETKAPVYKGLFSVQHQKDEWLFQVPDSLLNTYFLATTRYTATPVDAGIYGGEMVQNLVFYWQKEENKLLLRSLIYDADADNTSEISKAVKASTEDPIIGSFKIDSTLKDTANNKRYSINVTKFFTEDNQSIGIQNDDKTQFGINALLPDKSYIKDIKTFPINTEIQMVKTYSSKDRRLPSSSSTGVITIGFNTSFVLLPKTPMRRRIFDPRVGYFADSFTEYSDSQQAVKKKSFITRWRLEPKKEDIEKMKRGELVEPQKQIVFYIDPATPKQWRKYLIEGVNDWNVAFEKAGFKNAITAKEWPDDSTMSMEDARYSVIRYLASPISNAYGPQVHDPRSGEILESHVGWYHNVMKLVHDWYMIQAGCIDKKAQKMKFDDELMGNLIRFVSSHEIGHTLGLRHNMGASSATPVDSLRNKKWVEANGHTASIMDYARFNYVAQPEDNISESGIFPRINDYDKWAIEWGYKPIFNTKNEDEDRLLLNKQVIKQLAKSRRFWFGGEGYDNDPRAQTEDLGDNSMKASEYGIKNLKRIIKKLPEWTYEEGDMGDNLSRTHETVIDQFNRYVGHVCRNIGGIYHNYKSVEQSGNIYTPEEKSRQLQAMDFLNRNVFTEPTWLIEEPYVSRISKNPESLLHEVVDNCINNIISGYMITNLCNNSYAKDTYLPMDFTNDVVRMIFSETATGAKVTSYRRYLQRETVTKAISEWQNNMNSPAHPFIYSMLRNILSRTKVAHSSDEVTNAHYIDITQMITQAFNKK